MKIPRVADPWPRSEHIFSRKIWREEAT